MRTKQDSAARTAVHPDEVAQLFGYETGVALLAALKDVPRREAFVQEEVARRMAEAHPTVLTDRRQLRETVQTALHEEGTTEPLLREWAALKKLLPEGAPTALPLEAVRRAATLMAERTRVRRADAQTALLAEKRAGQDAAAAWAQGDIARANEAKLRQVLNHLLYRELAKLRPEVSAFNKLLNSATSKKTRQGLGQAGLHFREAVDALTESLGARPLTTDADTRSEALDALLAAMEEEKLGTAFDVNTVRSLLLEPRAWQDMTLSQMREVGEMLHQVQHLAETANQVHLEEKAASVDSLARTALDEVQGLPTVAPMPTDKALRGTWQAIRFKLGVSLQALRDPEEQLRRPRAHRAQILHGWPAEVARLAEGIGRVRGRLLRHHLAATARGAAGATLRVGGRLRAASPSTTAARGPGDATVGVDGGPQPRQRDDARPPPAGLRVDGAAGARLHRQDAGKRGVGLPAGRLGHDGQGAAAAPRRTLRVRQRRAP